LTAGSDEYNTLNAESVDLQNSIFIKSYYKFMSDMNPPKTSRVVSIFNTYLNLFYSISTYSNTMLLICIILSFRSTKSTAYAIASFIFVFCKGITSVVNLCFHFDYVRFGNTKDFFGILSTLDTISYQSTLSRAVLYFKWSLANCQLARRFTRKILSDLLLLEKLYFFPVSSQKIHFLWV
jgi:hypothetical protein